MWQKAAIANFPLMKRSKVITVFLVVCAICVGLITGCSSKIERETIKRTDLLIEEERYSDALSLLADSLEAEPENLKLMRQVVVVYLNANDPSTAYLAYRKLLLKPRKEGQVGEPEFRDSDPVLVDALKSKNPTVRASAAKTLSSVKEPDSVKPLIGLLKDKERDVRRAATNALGELRDKEATEGLIAILNDESWFVRGEAAQALGKIGDPQAIPALSKLLTDPDSYVRENAANAIRIISTEENVAVLEQMLESNDKLVKITAALSLAKFKKPKSEAVLLEFTRDPESDYRRLAVDGLTEMRSQSGLVEIRNLIQNDPAPEVRYICLLSIGLYGDKDSIPLLESVMKDKNNDPELRRAAFMAYRKIAEQNPEILDLKP